jgi:uncharacterized membrane protein
MPKSIGIDKLTILIIFLFAVSCKHEIPFPAGGGNGGGSGTGSVSVTCSPDTVYFQQQVLPIFISNCSMSGCHDNASHKEGIVLTSYSSIMTTGKIRAFQPYSGEIYEKITTSNTGDRMPPPPQNPLTADQKAAIYKWIMQGAKDNACLSSCDSAVYTYSAAIKPLISNQCQGCHSGTSASGGIDLSTYTAVKATVTNGKLWGSINHLPGYTAMPQNAQKLSDCQLKQFSKWIAAGAPNN